MMATVTSLKVTSETIAMAPVVIERDDEHAVFVLTQGNETIWLPYDDIGVICDWLTNNIPAEDAEQ